MNGINWLIMEVFSAPDNDLLSFWLTEWLISDRDMLPSEAARHVAELQRSGRAAAELVARTAPPAVSCRRRRVRSR